MKKTILILLFVLPMVACVSKKSADRLQSERDSLSLVLADKDSIINDVFASMNGIVENLNAIKSRENVIETDIQSGEIKKQPTTRISEDIETINQLLLQNKETIARLQRSAAQLKKANIKIDQLDKTIEQLSKQVEEKDSEITALKKSLADMNIKAEALTAEVTTLNTKVEGLAQQNTSLEGEVKNKTDILNTGYYILGPEKELLKREIIYKSGFIGRTLKINENRSLDSFTQIDIRNFDEVLIGQKRVSLISTHPEGSYELEMDDKGVYTALIIKDKDKFWEYSKVLVISYK